MPVRIPLINGGMPTLLNSGIHVAQTARLSEGQGAAAMGQALSNVGQDLAEIAKERQKANDANEMIHLEGRMRELTSEQMQFQNDNTDQESWGKAWDERVKGFEENDLKKARLSSEAKTMMASAFGRFSQGQSLQIQESANSQAKRRLALSVDTMLQREVNEGMPGNLPQVRSFAIAGGMLPEEIDNKLVQAEEAATNTWKSKLAGNYQAMRAEAIRVGDWQDVAALDVEAEKNGIITPEVKGALDGEVVRGQFSKDVMEVATRSPKDALQMVTSSDMPERDKTFLRAEVDRQKTEYERGEMAQIADAVVSGSVKRGKDIQFHWITSPADQAEIRAKVDALPPSSEQMVGEMLSLRSKIAGFDAYGFSAGDKESMKDYVEINARISKLPTEQRDSISRLWTDAKAGQMSVKDAFVSEGIKIIDEFYQAEEDKFFKKGLMGGRGDLRTGKEKEFATFKLRITQMESDLKKLITDDVTPDKAWEIISQVTSGAITDQRKSSYTPPAQSSGFLPVQSSGVEPALPAGGSIAFPILFPSVTP